MNINLLELLLSLNNISQITINFYKSGIKLKLYISDNVEFIKYDAYIDDDYLTYLLPILAKISNITFFVKIDDLKYFNKSVLEHCNYLYITSAVNKNFWNFNNYYNTIDTLTIELSNFFNVNWYSGIIDLLPKLNKLTIIFDNLDLNENSFISMLKYARNLKCLRLYNLSGKFLINFCKLAKYVNLDKINIRLAVNCNRECLLFSDKFFNKNKHITIIIKDIENNNANLYDYIKIINAKNKKIIENKQDYIGII